MRERRERKPPGYLKNYLTQVDKENHRSEQTSTKTEKLESVCKSARVFVERLSIDPMSGVFRSQGVDASSTQHSAPSWPTEVSSWPTEVPSWPTEVPSWPTEVPSWPTEVPSWSPEAPAWPSELNDVSTSNQNSSSVLPPHWPPSHTSTKHSNGSDDELEAIEGITVPTLSRKKTNARKWDIERLLKTQQAREKKKVVLITTEELHDAAEARSRQLIDAVRQECSEALGRICLAPPGESCLPSTVQDRQVLLTSLGTHLATNLDKRVYLQLSSPAKLHQMLRNLPLLLQLVTDKHKFLDALLTAACAYETQSHARALCATVSDVIKGCYDTIDEVSDWTVSCSLFHSIIKTFGLHGGLYPCTLAGSRETSHCKQYHILSVSVLLEIIKVTLKHNRFSSSNTEEICLLIHDIAKLSLDPIFINSSITPQFRCTIHYLISCPNDVEFGSHRSFMCNQLLGLSDFHHNLLAMVQLVPALSERSCRLRRTLAFLSIRLLVSGAEGQADLANWSMSDLADEFLTMNLSGREDDLYKVGSLLRLFDEAVGTSICSQDKVELAVMHSELTKVAGKLRMDASRGDLNEIRTIMHSITLKWAYLIRLATDIMEEMTFTHTPSKSTVVESSEVADDQPMETDAEPLGASNGEMVSMDSGDSAETLCNSTVSPICVLKNEQSVNRLGRSSPILDMRGLKKIGRIAREVLKARSSLQPHPSTSTNSTLVTSSTTQLSSHASSSSSSTDFSEPVTLSVEAQNAICDIKDKFSLRGEFIRDEPVSPRTKSTPSAMDKSDSRELSQLSDVLSQKLTSRPPSQASFIDQSETSEEDEIDLPDLD